MRSATITLWWEGPDKPIRQVIEDLWDQTFETLTEQPKLLYAHSDIKFVSRVEPEQYDGGADRDA